MRKKKDFHKKGKNGEVTESNTSKVEKKIRGRLWMVSINLESRLVIPIVIITQIPNLVVRNMEREKVILLELKVLWEENASDAEHRKERKYKELVKAFTEKGWDTEFHHIVVGY